MLTWFSRIIRSALHGPPLICPRTVRFTLLLVSSVVHCNLLAVFVPTTHILTARLTLGQKVQIFPLPHKSSSTSLSGLPSLRDIQEAGTIRLKEISSITVASPNPPEGKQRDWLRLLLRESLGLLLHAYAKAAHLPAANVGHLQLILSTLLAPKSWRLCMNREDGSSQLFQYPPSDRIRVNLLIIFHMISIRSLFLHRRNSGRLAGIVR